MNAYRINRGISTLSATILNKLRMKCMGIKYGMGFQSCGRITFVFFSGHMQIGDNVYINSKRIADPIGGQDRTIIQLNNGNIRIGNRVGISNAAICSSNSITIEDDVCIGAGCKIYDTDFHSAIAEYRLQGNSHVKTAPVLIKEKAFIGGHSIILKGVTIGKGAVVGAGSVVTSDIPDGEIWAGNPARFIKKVPCTKGES